MSVSLQGSIVSMTNNDAEEGEEYPDGSNRIGNRVLNESQSKVLNNGLKAVGDVNGSGRRESISQTIVQVQQQQSQGTAVNWERFLHIRSIKVLLVENDDSTRHIVTALLRNCNYEVIEAADGVQAWRILEDLTNQVDLILTEVVMPCLSGIGLLGKIMSHQTRKIIPVIMMSSHDSMGLVFKCLSKGAVDFLVKPIRKNELKNLWQHVWRRCHSSSGSGSGSGAPTQKSLHTRSSEKSDDSISNAGENNGSNGLNNIDGSDDGSGTQSSWTKQPIEADSSPTTSPTNQIANRLDNKCAQVNEPNAETSSDKRLQITAKKEGQEEEQFGYEGPLPATTNNRDSRPQSPLDVRARVAGVKLNSCSDGPSDSSSSRMGKEEESPIGKSHPSKHDLCHPLTSSEEFTNGQKVKDNPLDNPKEKEIELRLKRLRGIEGSDKTIQDNSNLLKHSEHSAFSRYNTLSSSAKATKAIMGSSCKNENCLEDMNKDSLSGHRNGNVVFPSSAGSNFIGVGSLTNTFPGNPIMFSSEAASTVNAFHPFSAFQPAKSDPRNIPPLATQVNSVDMQASSVLSPTRGVQLEHQEHHYHHFHNFEQEQKMPNYEKSSMEKLVTKDAHSGLLNVLGGPEAGGPENCNVNGSVSGSNYGSKGQNGSSSVFYTGLINGENGNLDGRIESIDASRSGSGNRIDETKLALREAGLLKFRQKRKERCFNKKVRYQNRKRLAEQRPRVRGQFVRQTDHSSSNDAASTDE